MQRGTEQLTRKILVVESGEAADPAMLSALDALGDVSTVRTDDEEMRALASGEFDLVIHGARRANDFSPEALFFAGRLFDRLGRGLCVVSASDGIRWANEFVESLPQPTRESILAEVRSLIPRLTKHGEAQAVGWCKCTDENRQHFFELTVTPHADPATPAETCLVLIRDNTDSQQLQQKINAIEAAGQEIVRLDPDALAQMEVGERLAVLEDKIIRYCRDLLHFDHFVIRVLDPKTKRLDCVIGGGMSDSARNLLILAEEHGQGISGRVAATGTSIIVDDVRNEAMYLPGLENARSSLTVPLRLNDQIVGVFNIESERENAFNETERQIAEIFGGYVAMALNILRLLAAERYTTTGQIAADVAAELAAPLNDIIADASALIDDTLGDQRVRRRLDAILANINLVKQAIKSVTQPNGISGLIPVQRELDPIINEKRILIADDDDAIRETISDVLSRAGATTTVARDGEEAIAIAKSQPFDLVISDIRMPGKCGYDVFAGVRDANATLPVIFITGFGYDPHHSVVRANKEGLAAVLFKPFKVEKLLEDVRNALQSQAQA